MDTDDTQHASERKPDSDTLFALPPIEDGERPTMVGGRNPYRKS